MMTITWRVQGAFQVTTQQPINYTIEEVDGLLDPANKVIRDFPFSGYQGS